MKQSSRAALHRVGQKLLKLLIEEAKQEKQQQQQPPSPERDA